MAKRVPVLILLVLLTLLIPIPKPASAGTITVTSTSISDQNMGASATYTFDLTLPSGFDAEYVNGTLNRASLRIAFPFSSYEWYNPGIAVQYRDAGNVLHDLPHGRSLLSTGSEIGYTVWRTTATPADIDRIRVTVSGMLNPSAGGIYAINLQTAYGSSPQNETPLDTGSAIIKLGLMDKYTSGDTTGSAAHGDTLLAQTFTVGTARKTTMIALKLSRQGSGAGTVRIAIKATDSNNRPTGEDLCWGSLDISSITTATAGEWYAARMNLNPKLEAGRRYAIVVTGPAGDGSTRVTWRRDPNTTFSEGAALRKAPGGSWAAVDSDSNTDFLFEEYGMWPNLLMVQASPWGKGTVDLEPDWDHWSGGYYPDGYTVRLTPDPFYDYYLFDHWEGGLTGTANPGSVVMNGDKYITAVFRIKTYTLNVTTSGSGTVTKNPNQATYDHGTQVQLTATPVAGYRFAGWSGGLTGTANPVTVTMDADKSITATFSNEPWVDVSWLGSGYVQAHRTDTWESVIGKTFPAGTEIAITSWPAEGWFLDHWEGPQVEGYIWIQYVNVYSYTTAKAYFRNTAHLDVGWTAGGGSVTPGSGDYPYLSTVHLTATPNSTWYFVGWEGDAYGWQDTADVDMWYHRSVFARFARDVYPVTITADHGSVTKSPNYAEYLTGTRVTFAAYPDSGYRFAGWRFYLNDELVLESTTNPIEFDIQWYYDVVFRAGQAGAFHVVALFEVAPPAITAANTMVVTDEGTPAVNNGTYSDATYVGASLGSVLQYATTWTWSYPAYDGPGGPSTITVVAANGALVAQTSFTLVVNNVAPTLTGPSDQTVDEGVATVLNLGSFTDPGLIDMPWTVRVDWGDGTDPSSLPYTSQGAISGEHTYADDGVYTAQVTVRDKDGAVSNSASFSVTVNSTGPVLAGPADQTAYEGTGKTFALGAFTDDREGDGPWTVRVDWGDGSAPADLAAASQGAISGDHTYADDGVYTAGVTVLDKDGSASETATFAVTVSNVAPTLTGPVNQTADEGTSAQFSLGSFADPGAGDGPWVVRVDWGDGTTPAQFDAISLGPVSANHTYADNGTYTVAVTVTDKDGGESDPVSFEINVSNVAPTLTAPSTQAAAEGTSATIGLGTFADPGVSDGPWAVRVDWGDGTGYTDFTAPGPGVISHGHAYADNGTYTVQVTVTDKDGDASSTASYDVVVTNVAPAVTAPPPQTAEEGTATTFSLGSFTDPGAVDGPWTVRVDWGDGTGPADSAAETQGALTRGHTYGDNGVYTVEVAVTDKDSGTSSAASFGVTVSNVAPTLTAQTDQTADEGTATTFDLGTFTDPGAGDGPWTVLVLWGDGTPESEFTVAGQGSVPAGHAYADNGIYTVQARVVDKDGAASEVVSFGVAVSNVAPALTVTDNQSADEGTPTTFSLGTFADPGLSDGPWTVAVDWGDGSAKAAFAVGSTGAVSRSHTYADNGAYTVEVTVTDKDEAISNCASFTITVANVAPALELGTDASLDEGGTFSRSRGFTDPGDDQWAATVDYGDGSGTQELALSGKGFDLSYTYTNDGSYTVTVTVSDDDGGSSSDWLIVTVNNVAPAMTPPAPQTVSELAAAAIDLGSFTDPGADSPWTVTVDWGDGTAPEQFTQAVAGSLGARSHSYGEAWDGTRTVTVTVHDGTEAGTATFTITVLEVNSSPVLAEFSDQFGPWGDAITFDAESTDEDVVGGSPNALTYSIHGAPAGASIDPTTGQFSWTPTEDDLRNQPTGGYGFTVRVTDDGTEPLHDEQRVTITVQKRAATLTYTGDQAGQYSDPTVLRARLADGAALLDGLNIEFSLGAQSANAATADGIAEVSPQLVITQAPGTYTVSAAWAGNDLYEGASDSSTYLVDEELALVEYTGPGYWPITAKATSVTVPVSAIITDFSDGHRGDIRHANVRFMLLDGSAVKAQSGWISVATLLNGETTSGVVSTTLAFSVPSSFWSTDYTVAVEVGNWYTSISTYCGVVHVERADLTDCVTGGGYIAAESAAGTYAPQAGSKINFGFSLKYNKKGTNIQGNANFIFRRVELVDGSEGPEEVLRVYQIKSSSAYNLICDLTAGTATYYSKANLIDVTDAENPIGLAGNCRLDMWVTDGGTGKDATPDTVGFALWSSGGELLFSSNWDGGFTVEQVLGGGNVVVR